MYAGCTDATKIHNSASVRNVNENLVFVECYASCAQNFIINNCFVANDPFQRTMCDPIAIIPLLSLLYLSFRQYDHHKCCICIVY